MSNSIKKKGKVILELTEVEADLIYNLLTQNEKNGEYYGNKKYYRARLEKLIKKLHSHD